MTEDDLRKIGYEKLPDGSWQKAGIVVAGTPAAQPQPDPVPTLAFRSGYQKGSAGRVALLFEIRRRRLLDPDNTVVKFLTDGLRRAELLDDDREKDVYIETWQIKVHREEDEGTKIIMIYPVKQ